MSAPIKSFDTAYPGSMVERHDGYFLQRDDHKSLAAALVELIASRDREIEDLRAHVAFLQRFVAAAPYLLEALQEARNGLVWYQEAHPELVDGSDDEAMARIDAAIAKAEGGAA